MLHGVDGDGVRPDDRRRAGVRGTARGDSEGCSDETSGYGDSAGVATAGGCHEGQVCYVPVCEVEATPSRITVSMNSRTQESRSRSRTAVPPMRAEVGRGTSSAFVDALMMLLG